MTMSPFRSRLIRGAGAAAFVAVGTIGALPGIAHADQGGRKVLAYVTNESPVQLKLVGSQLELDEGEWTKRPPAKIKKNGKASFGSRSDGHQSGTEATVVYRTKYGDVEIYWNHPWDTDDDEITCEAPDELTCDVHYSGTATVKAYFTVAKE
ncbi:hypothetical protein [Actinoplanes rectilineatus]|uniref:hypothetical protein n=1 Tax=Actinoplanes rectilineatus TaxID=113571 RepID=UPI000B0F5138|nr:hypothetical protein [Actinoplanes rectilineatus]